MPGGADFTITGVEQLRRALVAAGARAQAASRAALYEQAERIIVDATPLVPWDTGVLRGSHFVRRPTGSTIIEVIFGYGGAASDYAWVQHENTGFNHPNGGQAKYLRDAALMHAPTLEAQLAAKVRAYMGRV